MKIRACERLALVIPAIQVKHFGTASDRITNDKLYEHKDHQCPHIPTGWDIVDGFTLILCSSRNKALSFFDEPTRSYMTPKI